MGIAEYKAGMKLELAAHDIQRETGANQFFSLIHAAFRLADTNNLIILTRMFPETYHELMLLRQSYRSEMDEMSMNLIDVAKLMAKTRKMLGIGLVVFEIATEIANATGGNVDEIHYILSQNFSELVNAYEG